MILLILGTVMILLGQRKKAFFMLLMSALSLVGFREIIFQQFL